MVLLKFVMLVMKEETVIVIVACVDWPAESWVPCLSQLTVM
jgi:hypothetical protein